MHKQQREQQREQQWCLVWRAGGRAGGRAGSSFLWTFGGCFGRQSQERPDWEGLDGASGGRKWLAVAWRMLGGLTETDDWLWLPVKGPTPRKQKIGGFNVPSGKLIVLLFCYLLKRHKSYADIFFSWSVHLIWLGKTAFCRRTYGGSVAT